MAEIRIGISGWSYGGWKRVFYPDRLPPSRWLDHASSVFNSIEVNGTFYRLQRPETFASWRDTAPDGFVFALKGSRFITHNKKLTDIEAPLANFFAQGILRLGEKIGPFLWQFSESLRFRTDRFEAFLSLLPRDTHAAARLARKHDRRVSGRAWLEPGRKRRLRHALEVRNETFFCDEFVRLARRHGAAIVFSDSADWPYVEELTAPFVYLRLHGSKQTYASGYGHRSIERFAARVRTWAAGGEPPDAPRITSRTPRARGGRDVYVYFDNDQKAYAPRDALRLMHALGLGDRDP